jgi:hypothetical protein
LRVVDSINPALKSWLDNVIVPILVREYFADARLKNVIASESQLGIESAFKAGAKSEGNS